MTPMLELLTFVALVGWALYGIGKVIAAVERTEANVQAQRKLRPKQLVRR